MIKEQWKNGKINKYLTTLWFIIVTSSLIYLLYVNGKIFASILLFIVFMTVQFAPEEI